MALLLDEFDPRVAMARGATATQIVPETIIVQPDGTAMPRGEGVRNPNVGPGGSAEARGFRASRAAAAAGQAAAPAAAQTAARTAGGFIARGAAALAPTTPLGLALTAATSLPAMAEVGRDRGAGRSAADPTAGNPAAGDLRPGQLGAIRTDALGQARGEALRAAYDDPSLAGQSVGGFNTAVQRRANDIAVASTPLPPTGAGAGRGFVNPGAVRPAPDVAGSPGGRSAAAVEGAGAGRGFVNPPSAAAVDAAATPPGSGSTEATDRELRALGIERQNSAIRREMDAYGPGARNPDGTGGWAAIGNPGLERINRETDIASLRFDARLAGGRRGQEKERAAQQLVEGAQAQRLADQATEAGNARARATEATTRRGQDIEAGFRSAANRNAIEVANIQGRTQRDVAATSADSRVEAAEARGFRAAAPRFTVVPGGQEVREVNGIPMTVTVPARVLNNQTGQFVDAPQGGGAAPGGAGAQQPVTPKAEYDKLPKGARYVGPDGRVYIKG